MLTIRATQKEILARASFERWLVDHAQQFFPTECATLGAGGTLDFICEMVQQARHRGLTRGPQICSYVDLAFTFGRDFETRPWAVELVAEAAGVWSEFTMDALFEAAMAELDPEAGLGVEDEEDFLVVEEDEDEFEEAEPEDEDDEDEGERVNRDEQPPESGSGDGGPE
ncbi:MAG: hypothetical protein JMN27_03710 [gamma proteobacterium endosymbiont of Lamellibrachia anaximandri]|nr:hypothetical protein [gamma proteobacterium endosymbiont of Lamellibrachia anaximandri]MBL3532919.1 hypothetical protein [gamma proteobacterium endosymbiont of Lamellibrachia anaximandri]